MMAENQQKEQESALQEFLGKYSMSHKHLARLLGVTVYAIDSWSCGRRKISHQVLNHLRTIDERLTQNPELIHDLTKQDGVVQRTVS